MHKIHTCTYIRMLTARFIRFVYIKLLLLYTYVLRIVLCTHLHTYIVANSAGAKQCQNLMSLMLQEVKDNLSSEGM